MQLAYSAIMAKKKSARKNPKSTPLGNLDRLGGKKLMQHGAEEFSRVKESRKHSVGGGRKSG
jgi:ribosomal protein L4